MNAIRASSLAPFVVAVSLAACGGAGEDGPITPPPPPDPPGTVTTDLAFSPPYHCIDFETGSTIGGTQDLCVSGSNFVGLDYTDGYSRIAGVGTVAGLGEITSLPTAGWVRSAAASLGSGYVVLTREGNAYSMFASAPAPNAYRVKWALLQLDARPPSPPLTVVTSTGAATLSWSGVSGATGYVIRYYGPLSTGQGNPRPATPSTITVASPGYQHSGLDSGYIYEYFVTAVFPWGETVLPPYTAWTRVTIP